MKIILPLVLLLTAACSSMGPIDAKKRGDINDIGMVSVVPAESTLHYMGTTIFENQKVEFLTDTWDLAGQMQQELALRLKENGKSVKPLKFKEVPSMSLKEYSEKEVKKLFPDARNQGAKFLFVVSPTRHGSLPFPEGIALYCRSAFGMKGGWTATYQVHMALWDLTTEEVVYQTAYMPGDGMFDSKKPCSSWQKANTQKFADSFKTEMQGLARKAVLKALQNSELTPGREETLKL